MVSFTCVTCPPIAVLKITIIDDCLLKARWHTLCSLRGILASASGYCEVDAIIVGESVQCYHRKRARGLVRSQQTIVRAIPRGHIELRTKAILPFNMRAPAHIKNTRKSRMGRAPSWICLKSTMFAAAVNCRSALLWKLRQVNCLGNMALMERSLSKSCCCSRD